MERLVLLCLLSPAIFARPHKTKDPKNGEPFLPIHPVYPYSPKLIKRGTEGEVNSQLTSELHAPKVDAKDTYSSSYSSTYQRDPYYPDYNPYLTNNTPSFVYPVYYSGGEAYVYANTPYPAYNSPIYPTPYSVNPMSYPNYYQSPYYYPHYFSHALFSPPPPPSGVDYYRETSQVPVSQDDKQDAYQKGERAKEDETSQDAPTSQFVDGNYIAGNSQDLDVQSSTYKVASPYNQLARDVKNLPIFLPKATYRVISEGGQPVNPDYPLSTAYVKAQQIEQMTSQTLSDLLAQNARQQSSLSYENSRDTLNGANDGSYENAYNPNAPSYVTLSAATAKTGGVTYVIDPVGLAKVNGEQAKHQGSSSQRVPSKNTKYSNIYARKPPSRNHPQASYVSSESRNNHRARVSSDGRSTGQSDKYTSYDASQSYGGTYNQSGDKQKQNYGTYQSQPGSYQSEGVTVAPQTPRSHSYQYSAYESDQVQQQQQQQQQQQRPQQDETNTDDGTFGTKEYKG